VAQGVFAFYQTIFSLVWHTFAGVTGQGETARFSPLLGHISTFLNFSKLTLDIEAF
jgi:hypothetical protein